MDKKITAVGSVALFRWAFLDFSKGLYVDMSPESDGAGSANLVVQVLVEVTPLRRPLHPLPPPFFACGCTPQATCAHPASV